MRIASRHIIAIAFVLPAALLIATAPRAGAFDFVSNGGFESGDDGWFVSPGADLDAVDAAVVPVRQGLRSGRIVVRAGSSSFSIRRPSVDVSAPGTYQFTAWARTTSRSTEVYADVDDSATTNHVRFETALEPNVWIELSGQVAIAPFSSITIAISGRGEPGDVLYVDGVQLEGAPPIPPATKSPLAQEAVATRTPPPTPPTVPQPTTTPHAVNTPAPAAAPDPIGPDLRNGDFESATEDGSPAGWEKYGGTLSRANSPVHSGAYAARLQSDTDSTKWLYQTVAVTGGDWYAFDAWVLHDDDNVRSASLRVSWYASGDGSGRALASADSSAHLTSPAPEYRFLSTGSIAVPGDARSARLRILLAPVSATPASILVDDATFAPSAPSSAPLDPLGPDDPSGSVLPVSAMLGAARTAADGGPLPADGDALARIPSGLLISEVMYDPLGSDDAEWVELYNASDESVSLAGWALADATGAQTLLDALIGPGEFIVVAASDSLRTGVPSFTGAPLVLGRRIGNGLGNQGDRLLLRDPSGGLADAISWGDDVGVLHPAIAAVPAGHSIERSLAAVDTDSAADWVDNMRPSPGTAFQPAPPRASSGERSATTQTLGRGERSLPWLPWAVAAASALGLLTALSWRVTPLLSERLRRHA